MGNRACCFGVDLRRVNVDSGLSAGSVSIRLDRCCFARFPARSGHHLVDVEELEEISDQGSEPKLSLDRFLSSTFEASEPALVFEHGVGEFDGN